MIAVQVKQVASTVRSMKSRVIPPRHAKGVYGNVDSLAGRIMLLKTLVKGLVPKVDLSSNDYTLPLLPDQQG